MINYDRSKKSSLRKRDSNLIGTKPSSLKSYLTKNTRINSVHVRIEKNMGKKPKNIKIKKTDWLIFPHNYTSSRNFNHTRKCYEIIT